jgi:alpha-N-arabinofuranosidase
MACYRQVRQGLARSATVTVYSITAGLHETASLDQPDRIRSVQRTLDYRSDLTIDLDPYTVAVVEVSASLRQDGQR